MQNETINNQLKNHQVNSDWEKKDLVKDLHVWAERFNFEFKLETSTPAIMIDCIGRQRHGHYRPGRNGFGLRDEIAINESSIHTLDYWEVLGFLLHELLHAEQHAVGKPGKYNYHNKQYQDRAKSFGLIVNHRGETQFAPAPTPFTEILKKYGVDVPALPDPEVQVKKPGNSKLKLWTCKCKPQPVRVRVAIQDFQAQCLKCNSRFTRCD